jgi:hypothetical protein
MKTVNKDCIQKMLCLVGLRKTDGKLLYPTLQIVDKPENDIEEEDDMHKWIQYEEKLSDIANWSY